MKAKDNDVKVSVIVPVYNVAPYLAECLASLCRQTLREIEILCVCGVSNDDSAKIAEKFAQGDERIRIYEQENLGLSAARNLGAEHATGKYLYFCDSDDYLEDNGLELLYQRIEACSGQMVLFDANTFCQEADFDRGELQARRDYQNRSNDYPEVYSGKELMFLMYANGDYIVSAWGSMILRDYFIKGKLQFPFGLLHEDQIYTFRALMGAERVCYLPLRLYNYRVHGNSLMARTDASDFQSAYAYFKAWQCMRDVLFSEGFELENHEEIAAKFLREPLLNARRIYRSLPEEKKKSCLELPSAERLLFETAVMDEADLECSRLWTEKRKEEEPEEKEPFISVIIPVYNAEKLLPRCLDSIVRQTIDAKEVLCIDDGSTDGSSLVLQRYAETYPWIHCYTQENQGPAVARNYGLRQAKGKYIAFLDTDDWYIDEMALERLTNAAEESGCKMAAGYRQIYVAAENRQENMPYLREFGAGLMPGDYRRIHVHAVQEDYHFHQFIYERSMLQEKGIFFPEDLRCNEDPIFHLTALLEAEEFALCHVEYYSYWLQNHIQTHYVHHIKDIVEGIRRNMRTARKYGLKRLQQCLVKRLNNEYYGILRSGLDSEVLEKLREIRTACVPPADIRALKEMEQALADALQPLDMAPSDRMIVYGVGAHFFDMMEWHPEFADRIAFLVDKDPRKIGVVLHRPRARIVSPQVLRDLPFGTRVIISAIRYFGEISAEIYAINPGLRCMDLDTCWELHRGWIERAQLKQAMEQEGNRLTGMLSQRFRDGRLLGDGRRKVFYVEDAFLSALSGHSLGVPIARGDLVLSHRPDLQGQVVEGLPICHPEVLRDLPETPLVIVFSENYENTSCQVQKISCRPCDILDGRPWMEIHEGG